MAGTLTLYSFEDKDGEEEGTFTTMNYEEAKKYARTNKCIVIGNEYEWSDSEHLDDFTEKSSEEEFKAVLELVTVRTLEEMKNDANCKNYGLAGFPSTYDINCGKCEDWANAVNDEFPGATAGWTDDFGFEDEGHCVVKWNDRYYDAECHEGVTDIRHLPCIRNRGKSRKAVLKARKSMPTLARAMEFAGNVLPEGT